MQCTVIETDRRDFVLSINTCTVLECQTEEKSMHMHIMFL